AGMMRRNGKSRRARAMSMREFITLHCPQSVVPPADPESSPIYKLLDWLVNHWPKPTVTARNIYTYGPNCTRNWQTTLSLAQILVEKGWLPPVKTHRHDMREWKIVRGPEQ